MVFGIAAPDSHLHWRDRNKHQTLVAKEVNFFPSVSALINLVPKKREKSKEKVKIRENLDDDGREGKWR